MKGDFNYLENSQTRDVYEIMDNAALSIGTHSTLLYENLSRENKCFVFNFRHEKYPFNTKRFGYFSNLPTSGEIWYQGTDIDFFLKKIEFLLNCSDNEWKTILNRYSDETCYYNYENTILKNYLNDYLSNKNL